MVHILIFCTSFLSFFLELLISRVFMSTLGYGIAFLAIPLALLGLTLGSLYRQFLPKNQPQIQECLLAFIGFVLLDFSYIFLQGKFPIPLPYHLSVLTNALFTGSLFLIPFFFSGIVLSELFQKNSDKIGRLYFFDLLGGSSACLAMPVLFHFFDLQIVLLIFITASFIVYAMVSKKVMLSAFLTLLIFASIHSGSLFAEHAPYEKFYRSHPKFGFVELQKKWNEYSRVALTKIIDKNIHKTLWYAVVHDNRESNVLVKNPVNVKNEVKKNHYLYYPSEYVPTVLNMHPKNILVLFAGCGNEMIYLDELHKEDTPQITGVELNPLVKSFCSDSPFVKKFELKKFYSKPNINLVISEGRNYLQRNREEKYDVIFISRDGSAYTNLKQMNTAKYLSTFEAYREFTRHLEKYGVIIFASDPGWQNRLNPQRLETLKYLHGTTPRPKKFFRSVFIGNGFIVYKPSGFGEDQFKSLSKAYPKKNNFYARKIVLTSLNKKNIMTDDRPFQQEASLKSAIGMNIGKNLERFQMIRMFSIAVLFILTALILFLYSFLTRSEKEKRLSFDEKSYFILTGFAYMCLQIGLIGRFDLFLGNPFYSMALIITSFLLFNGLGSLCAHSMGLKIQVKWLLLIMIPLILTTKFIVDFYTGNFLSLELIPKIGLGLVGLFPVCFGLGFFFPCGVQKLNQSMKSESTSSAYAFSVLSSVLGATYSLFIVTVVGYNAVILHAVPVYAALLLKESLRPTL